MTETGGVGNIYVCMGDGGDGVGKIGVWEGASEQGVEVVDGGLQGMIN